MIEETLSYKVEQGNTENLRLNTNLSGKGDITVFI